MADSITVLVRCPDLGLPSRFITLPSHLSLHHLKLSILPRALPLHLSSFFFSAGGKPLSDSLSISSVVNRCSSSLTLGVRFRGGGGDGGATGAESRDCYLSMYLSKKPDKADPNEARLSKWTTCALSGEPLAHPVVVDRLGNIFNKEPLVEALLHKKLPRAFAHIRGLKDMIPVHLELIPGNEASHAETRFQCPVTGVEFNGKYPFFAIKGCGHILSSKAVKEVKSSSCLVCHKDFTESDKIAINGSEEEVKLLRERMEEERYKAKEKKEKASGSNVLSGKKRAEAKGVILENGRKEDAGAKRFKAVDIAPAHATKEVYASIFTSSSKGKFKETYSCRSLPLGRN